MLGLKVIEITPSAVTAQIDMRPELIGHYDHKWRSACEDDPLRGLVEPIWQTNTVLSFTQTGLPDAISPLGQAAGQVSLQQVVSKWVPKGMICNPTR